MRQRKSREQGLITKECVATHTNCFYDFKMALYCIAIVMKGFNSSRKLF